MIDQPNSSVVSGLSDIKRLEGPSL
jgi:hypothetical protein